MRKTGMRRHVGAKGRNNPWLNAGLGATLGLGLAGAATLSGAVLAFTPAEAFCGFYVSGGESSLFNDATQVVLMRSGTQTVLSMQNSYQGPAEGFAMVVPVPQVLMEENVKTLSKELFDKIDKLSAPRLVEYWEVDPCQDPELLRGGLDGFAPDTATSADKGGPVNQVVVEAQFEVGEYEVVVLSSTEATALENWLTTNSYNIPAGAAPVFEDYIAQGQYFFVAKVNPDKVEFTADGRVVLSPLRFHYESDKFSLPIRMGMVNSQGKQDLIAYILSPEGRFEVANYNNVTIPTNIEVAQDVRKDFGDFYTKLFDKTLEENPGSVVTEYAWDAKLCDPCPGPWLDQEDFLSLGADELGGDRGSFVLTRLHARYDDKGIGGGGTEDDKADLVFKSAPPLVGGREFYPETKTLASPWNPGGGKVEKGSTPVSTQEDAQELGLWRVMSQFQGRYIMRNRWEGEITCDNPVRNRWGGPWDQDPEQIVAPSGAASPNTEGKPVVDATAGALANRQLATLVTEDIAEIGVTSMEPVPVAGTAGAGGATGDADLGDVSRTQSPKQPLRTTSPGAAYRACGTAWAPGALGSYQCSVWRSPPPPPALRTTPRRNPAAASFEACPGFDLRPLPQEPLRRAGVQAPTQPERVRASRR